MAKGAAAIKEEVEEEVTVDNSALLEEAEEEFKTAKTRKDVASIWKKYYGKLGHRKLGRLIIKFA